MNAPIFRIKLPVLLSVFVAIASVAYAVGADRTKIENNLQELNKTQVVLVDQLRELKDELVRLRLEVTKNTESRKVGN